MSRPHSFFYLNRLSKSALLISVMFFLFMGCRAEGEAEYFPGEEPLPEIVDYNQHVRGILSETCFACHGPDSEAREAGLRLDTEEGAFSPLGENKDRYAIISGNPRESELYKRITSTDPDYMMPAPTSNLTLSDREIAILRRWIEQGAEYKPHWAYIPPEKPNLPGVSNKEWSNNQIDSFILAKLEAEGIEPTDEAEKEKLLRRVSFDLTGLPPTVEELDNFLSDDSMDAYEKVVDRLLESEAYGERMATEWLDVARYADTHGHQDDKPNEMWPWREWVINAFNRNMPFDQFTTWQLAGDLLPEATREQKLATGFNRVHPQSVEAGIIDEEYRVEYSANRVQTTGAAFLGQTMQCARCHDHKYDPISIKEYYEFFAFFDSNNDAGRIPYHIASGPTILLPDDETEEMIHYLQEQIDRYESNIQDIQTNKRDEFIRWQRETSTDDVLSPLDEGLIAYLPLNEIIEEDKVLVHHSDSTRGAVNGTLQQVDGKFQNAIKFERDNYINLGKIANFERTDSFSFSFWVQPADTSGEIPLIAKMHSLGGGNRGYDISLMENRVSFRLVHGWPHNAIHVLSAEKIPVNNWSHVSVTYDGSSNADGVRIYINGKHQEMIVDQDQLFKNMSFESPDIFIGNRSSTVPFSFEEIRLDEIRIFDRRLSAAEIVSLADRENELSEILARVPGQLSNEQRNVLFDHYLLHLDNDFKTLSEELHEIRVKKSAVVDTIKEAMVMEDRLNPRPTYIRERGIYDNHGDPVSPGVPKSIMEFPDDFPRNRLGLAQWILHPDNPLTARVIVNRYWQMLFGTGLVDTPDDFGNQGSMPSHPELLDWLAVSFREGGWDVKGLLKQIVMSSAYRQSSKIRPELHEKDPQNRLFARGPRYRLPAEMIRDNALAASGLLIDEIGGPSVFPYQPEGLWKETSTPRYLEEYIPSEGKDLYRRSLYTFWKRSSPPPGMTTFDAAMRTHPTVQRGHTSTPLQALHTLNDPIYVEASRLLAERMMKEGGERIEDQIIFAFQAAVSRAPGDRELQMLKELYEEELQSYREKPDQAEMLLNVGEYPADSGLDSIEIAARTIVASTIFNLDETLSKE